MPKRSHADQHNECALGRWDNEGGRPASPTRKHPVGRVQVATKEIAKEAPKSPGDPLAARRLRSRGLRDSQNG
jgi:hypothetical protein